MSRALDIARILEKLRRGEKLSDEEIELLLLFIVKNMVVDHVDRVADEHFEKKLRRYVELKRAGKATRKVLGRTLSGNEFRTVMKSVKNGKTQMVIHQIFGSNGSLRHLGIEGVRGWDAEDLNKVSFTYKENEYQFDVLSEGKRVDRWRRKKGKK